MKNFLYFAEAAGADADGEAVVIPVENVIGIYPTAATTCNLHFKNPKVTEGTDADTTNNYVELTYTSGAFKVVCDAIVGAINATHSSGMAVIADGDNSVFVIPEITACLVAIGDADINPDN